MLRNILKQSHLTLCLDMKNIKVEIFLLILTYCIFNVDCTKLTIYEDDYYVGNSLEFQITYNGECHNLPNDWLNRVSSLDSNGLCVNLYDELNCTGEKITVYPGAIEKGPGDLDMWNFNNQLKSIEPCKNYNYRINSTTGNIIIFYDEPGGFEGYFLYLNVDSCKNVPETWRNKISSMVTFNRCYTFYTGKNCSGRLLTVPQSFSSVESLIPWDFDKQISSVDICASNITSRVIYTKVVTTNAKKHLETDKTTRKIVNSKKNENTEEESFGSDNTIFLSVGIPILFLFVLMIIVVVVIFAYFRKRNSQNTVPMEEVRREFLCQKYIQCFMKGNPLAFEQISIQHADPIYRAMNLPYNVQAYEIPLECICIDIKYPLGSGEFGIVSKAMISCPQKFPKPIRAAVKRMRAGVDPAYIKAILEELKIMMYLQEKQKPNKHPHILTLIGACTEKIEQLQPYIILQFCSEGSLDVYLRKQRKYFVDLLAKDPKDFIYSNQVQINTLTLVDWSAQIANGMEFLVANKVIHGDLASRNILLDENLLVKISDFGLSRQLYQYSQYVKKNQAPLPWRWMAIEALQDLTFSVKSDVWSYGITLWEIFSLAEIPYPGVLYTSEFLVKLNEGYRLAIPPYASPDLYDIIKNCWQITPDDRPSFTAIRHYLATVKNGISTQVETGYSSI